MFGKNEAVWGLKYYWDLNNSNCKKQRCPRSVRGISQERSCSLRQHHTTLSLIILLQQHAPKCFIHPCIHYTLADCVNLLQVNFFASHFRSADTQCVEADGTYCTYFSPCSSLSFSVNVFVRRFFLGAWKTSSGADGSQSHREPNPVCWLPPPQITPIELIWFPQACFPPLLETCSCC